MTETEALIISIVDGKLEPLLKQIVELESRVKQLEDATVKVTAEVPQQLLLYPNEIEFTGGD